MTTQSRPSITTEIRVRYAEVDRMGMLHHSRYWVYFEIGRTELLRSAGLAYRDMEDAGVFFVVARCGARFHSPARYDDLLVLTTCMEKLGPAKIEHSYELHRQADAALLATAETTLACVGADGHVIAIPPEFRSAMERVS